MKNVITLMIVFVGCWLHAQSINFVDMDNNTLNYGVISKGTDGTRVIEFTNDGKAPLILTQVTSSCNCTVASYDKNPIMPKQKGKITIRYNTQKTGSFQKNIKISTNDPKNPERIVLVKGEVKE